MGVLTRLPRERILIQRTIHNQLALTYVKKMNGNGGGFVWHNLKMLNICVPIVDSAQ